VTASASRLDSLTSMLAELLEEDPEVVAASGNLFELGLDSISLMHLVSRGRQAGLDIDFAELAEQPTVAAWTRLLAARQAAAASRARSEARAVAPAAGEAVGPAAGEAVGPAAGEHPPPVTEPTAERDGAGPAREEFDLAPMQHAYWIGRSEGQPLGGVGAHLYAEFDGAGVDPERLAAALHALLDRHDMLRVRVGAHGRQRIAAEAGWRGLAVHDLRDRGPAEVEQVLAAAREEYSHQALDLEAGEVLGTALSLLPGGHTRFHLDVDLVAADAVSYRVLLADLARLYTAPGEKLPHIGLGYRDYLERRAKERAESTRRAATYWDSRRAELPEAPRLPLVADHPAPGSPRVTREHELLRAAEREALAVSARQHGVTLAAAVATAFAEVIGAWSAEPRFLLNVPMFDRAPVHPDVERLVGDFTSSVPLAIDLSEPRGFADRVRDTQARLHTDAAHADHPGVAVLRERARERGRPVLAPVVFTSALNLGELFRAEVTDTFGETVWLVSQTPQVLLDAQVTEVAGGLLVNWDVRQREFAPGVVRAMFAAFCALLRRLAVSPDAWRAPVGELRPAPRCAVRGAVEPTRPPRGRPGPVPPTDELQRAIALVWGELLGSPGAVGATDDFFAAGGDSVRATALVNGVREALDSSVVTVRMLYAAPTVAGLAARIRAADPHPERLDRVAALYCVVAAMTDDEVVAALGRGCPR